MTRFAPEGYPFIAGSAALALGVYVLFGPLAAALPLALALFMLYFFRDPERRPAGEGFLSPADGRVIKVEEVYEGDYLRGKARLISIFMSPLDVHVNRSPCDGEVREVRHTPGSFKSAYTEDAHLGNENTAMLLDRGGPGPVLVRQVAGSLARRVVCRVRPGDRLGRGQRYGMIKFSSRVDLYLPPDSAVKVKFREKVRAGETVLAAAGDSGQ